MPDNNDASTDEAQDNRLNDLEMQVALQNRTIDELSDALREQWDKIDLLTRQVRKLNDRLAATEGDLQTVMPPDRPPPHY
jgi:SlyX protein